MINYEIISLDSKPQIMQELALWQSQNWGVPLSAYLESMGECLRKKAAFPQWYAAVENGKIIAGLGVIENDFHDRKDLAPNVCAVYVNEEYRKQGIAGEMLKFVCRDMARRGEKTLYLVTDHNSFYEKYGWQFLCLAQGDGEEEKTRVYVHKLLDAGC